MKNSSSFIRWKFVIPTAVVVGGILVFFIIFFDPLLGRAIEMVGSRVNGAKVDVTSLKTKIFQGRLSIGRLQVTNKENTMKNVIEAGPMAFQLDFSELLTKRVIIPEASLDGVQFNTDRKHDGKLRFFAKKKSDEKPSAVAKLTEKYSDQFQLNLGQMKTDAKAKIEFDPKDLNLTKDANALKAQAEGMPDAWKQKVNGLNIESRLKTVEANLKAIENTPTKGTEALMAIPESLKKLKEVKADLEKIKSDLKSTREGLTGDLKSLKSGITGLQDAKKKDLDELLSRLNLDFANPKHLADGIIGGAVFEKVKLAMHYFQLVRNHLPSKKDEAVLPPKPRAGGMDIEFFKPAAPPRFWLKKASLSGLYDDISAAGNMTNLTTSPSRVGKPFVANLKGTKSTSQFMGELVSDHVTEVSKDRLSAEGKNLEVLSFMSGGPLAASLKDGRGDLGMSVDLLGDNQIAGHVQMNLHSLKIDENVFLSQFGIIASASLSKEEALKISFMKNIAHGLERMPSVQVRADLSGSWSNPNMKLSTNLDDMMKNVVKNSFGSVVEGQKKELEAKLDTLLSSQKSELDQKTAGLQGKINEMLGGLDSQVQDKINKATKINLGGSSDGKSSFPVKIPSLDNLFKK